MVKRAMKQDFSWEVSADKYINLYSEISGVTVEKPEKAPKKTTAKKATAKQTTKEGFERFSFGQDLPYYLL